MLEPQEMVDDQFIEDPTDDELLAAEMGIDLTEKSWGDVAADGLIKAVGHKYISRKRMGKRWEYVYPDDKKKQARRAAAVSPAKTPWGKLPPGKTSAEHIEIAKEFLGRHKKVLPQALAEIKELAGPNADVKGRVKTVQSALGKMAKKPKYTTADKLQDGSGLRAIHKTIDEVKATVAKIKAKYKILDEDNYIDTPQGDYRSHHLIIEGPDGLAMEVQVRTENQNTFADWCHDVYKPVTAAQAKVQHDPEVKTYANAIADYFWAIDSGQELPPKPPCYKKVALAFGCL